MATEKPATQEQSEIYGVFVAIAKANRHPEPESWAEAAERAYDDGVAYPDEEDAGEEKPAG